MFSLQKIIKKTKQHRDVDVPQPQLSDVELYRKSYKLHSELQSSPNNHKHNHKEETWMMEISAQQPAKKKKSK